jgi:predicted metal-dependent peptidase
MSSIFGLTAQQKIERANVWLMHTKETAVYSGVITMGDKVITEEVQTAATNGYDTYYNSGFVDSLAEEEIRFLILHEAAHKIYLHLVRGKDLPDKELANCAMDYVVNLDLDGIHPDVKIPKGGLLDKRFTDMSMEQVYKILESEQQGSKGGKGGGKPMDKHMWEEAKGMDGQKLEQEVQEAIRQGAILAGKLNGNVPRSFKDIMAPKVNWREQLRDFVSSICRGAGDTDWGRPNRRFMYQDLYLPASISQTTGSLVVAIDTSGSISNETLSGFLSELMGIVDTATPERIDLIYWDADVQRHEAYMPMDYSKLIKSTKPKGGGGTDVKCVIKYIANKKLKPVAAVIFTDGELYDGFGQWDMPTLWAIIGNKRITSTTGVTIHIE